MSKKTLNKANLENLGAEKLAELLIEVSTGSADIKRRLRLELSHNLGPAELAHDVRKRLVSLRKSKSFVSWRKRKALVKDLATQHAMIVEKIAPEDPSGAFALLWQFIEIAPSVYERVDDSRGEVGDVFRGAIMDFEDLAPRAGLEPALLAQKVWGAIQDNDYGEWDGIISLTASALGASGLEHLKAEVETYAQTPVEVDDHDHDALQFLRQLRGGTNYAAERRARSVKMWLQEIAAAAGDTGAYIDQYSQDDLRRKDIAAEVAQLYLSEGRASDALDLLEAADPNRNALGAEEWDGAYVATLTALDRFEDAQNHRWTCFETTLSVPHLRAYLKHLPDFEDVEAEERAKAHVLTYPVFSEALRFCLNWPDLLTAAHLIERRADEIDGDAYWLLTPAAEALRPRHPLAAVIVLRAMIDFSLGQGRSSRYGHAADHLADCAQLDAEIEDYGPHKAHAAYLNQLQTRHERKSSFWAKVR